MSILVTLRLAVLVGTTTFIVVGSRAFVNRAASASAISLSLSPGTSRMSLPIIAFLILTCSIQNSGSGTFCLAVASISAYDIFVPSLSVRVTADNRGGGGSITFLVLCTDPPVGVNCEVLGTLAAAGLFATFLFLLCSITFHLTPFCPFEGDDIWVALPCQLHCARGNGACYLL